MPNRIFLTTPIYYVNAEPHIGHAYTTIVADLLTRFHQARGDEIFFLTGTDEHGANVAAAAKKAGLSPQEHCDRIAGLYRRTWQALSIKEDYFVRTTDKRHQVAVEKFLLKLHESRTPKGEPIIYEGKYQGLYCLGCEKFLTEKELVNGLCPLHQTKPQLVSEKNYFFRLSAYLDEVQRRIETDQICIRPEERKRETLGLFKQGLEDFSLSREKVTWGIPLPFDPKQTAYVWVDALLNYLSAIGYGDDAKQFDTWWNQAKVVHLMAKEILKFHAIYWPALLLAAGIKPPEFLFIHGFFSVNGQKMSKSLGNVIDPHHLVSRYGPDGTRFLLLTQFPFGVDGDIQAERFTEKYNADLANDFGNLASRVFKLVADHFNGEVPQPGKPTHEDKDFQKIALNLAEKTLTAYVGFAGENGRYVYNDALAYTSGLVKEANRYMETQAPWALAKEGKREQLATVLYYALESLRLAADLYAPALPNKCAELKKALGESQPTGAPFADGPQWGLLKPGTKIKLTSSLFPRLEQEKVKMQTMADDDQKNQVTIDEFGKLDLRVAQVTSAQKVTGADKLLQLEVEVAGEKRQVIAGVAQHYTPEVLLGKKIVVVWNLKPAKIRGLESQGMLLAAQADGQLVLVTVDGEIKTGAKIS